MSKLAVLTAESASGAFANGKCRTEKSRVYFASGFNPGAFSIQRGF